VFTKDSPQSRGLRSKRTKSIKGRNLQEEEILKRENSTEGRTLKRKKFTKERNSRKEELHKRKNPKYSIY